MLKQLIVGTLTCATVLSCQQIDTDELSTNTTTEQRQAKQVQFVMKGITEEYSTRATVASVGCTDIWIWEGTTLLAHKVSTDSDFDTPTLSLTYGSHDLTFVASLSEGQSLTAGKWTCTKVDGVFATKMNVTVSSGSSNSRQVQLTRRNSRVKLQTTDKVPSNVTKLHLTVGNYLSLNSDLSATDAQARDVTIDITSKQGSTYSVFVNNMTASLTEEEVPVLVEFLSATNDVLYKYERTVKLKPNRCVTLTGDFFGGSSNAISIVTTEWDNVTQNLFE